MDVNNIESKMRDRIQELEREAISIINNITSDNINENMPMIVTITLLIRDIANDLDEPTLYNQSVNHILQKLAERKN